MNIKKISLFLLYCISILVVNASLENERQSQALNLVISMDGMRFDYIDRYSNADGFLMKLAKIGVRTNIKPIFPTNTYPNHWSIATGLYAERHGIINNDVYDPNLDKYFKMNAHQEDLPGWFEKHEPLWITNQKSNNKNKHSIVIDWPGSSVTFDLDEKSKSNYMYRHPKDEFFHMGSFNKTIDVFIENLNYENTNLACIYFGEPDITGHKYGPDSKETKQVIKELDYILEYLFKRLKDKKFYLDIDMDKENKSYEKNEFRPINFVLLTDHGMQQIRERDIVFDINRHVFLSDFIDVKHYLDIDKSSCGSFSELWLIDYKNETKINELYKQLKEVQQKINDKIHSIYLKKDIPERFYIKSHHRTSPIILIAQKSYQIFVDRERIDKYATQKYHGNHGYDYNLKSMEGTFLAVGKPFKKNYYSMKPINLIDIYSLICKITNIEPRPNNGSFDNIKHVLSEEYLISINHDYQQNNYEFNFLKNDLKYILMYGGLILIVFLIAFLSLFSPSIMAFNHNKNKKKT